MDNLTLEVLLHELVPALLNKTIQKIKQTSDRTLIFALRSRQTEFLTLCLNPSHPSLFLSEKENRFSESVSTDWLMTLRKYLVGGRIVNLNKKLADRILFFDFESNRVSSRPEKLTLVLQLIPPRPNALLLNESQEILASFLTQKGPSLAQPAFYTSPETKSAFSVDQIAKEEFQGLVRSCRLSTESETVTISHRGAQLAALEANKEAPLWSKLSGISPFFVREIAYEAASDPEVLWERLQLILKRVRYGPYSPQIYLLKPSVVPSPPAKVMSPSNKASGMSEKILVVPFPFDSLKEIRHQQFLSLNAACIEAYQIFSARSHFLKRQQSLITKVSAHLKKRARLLQGLQADLRKNEGFEIFKKYADLLYAQQEKPSPGKSMLRATDLFDPNQAEIEVPLDPRFSAVQNANRYSKLYQKANRSIPSIKARILQVEAEIELLDFQHRMLANADTVDHLEKAIEPQEKISGQTRVAADPHPERNTAKDTLAHPPSLLRKAAKSFISSEGLTILAGKSSKDNDILTSRIAKSEDFWFHAAGYGGSHVVLKNPEKLTTPPRQSLLEAAQVAAYFSQARNAPKVEVHYTQKKFVSKPKGAKPGLVRLKEYKSISVRPRLPGAVAEP
jgi:predicted ribosome quality control (RQC) complex YloA/Tae2 family protein